MARILYGQDEFNSAGQDLVFFVDLESGDGHTYRLNLQRLAVTQGVPLESLRLIAFHQGQGALIASNLDDGSVRFYRMTVGQNYLDYSDPVITPVGAVANASGNPSVFADGEILQLSSDGFLHRLNGSGALVIPSVLEPGRYYRQGASYRAQAPDYVSPPPNYDAYYQATNAFSFPGGPMPSEDPGTRAKVAYVYEPFYELYYGAFFAGWEPAETDAAGIGYLASVSGNQASAVLTVYGTVYGSNGNLVGKQQGTFSYSAGPAPTYGTINRIAPFTTVGQPVDILALDPVDRVGWNSNVLLSRSYEGTLPTYVAPERPALPLSFAVLYGFDDAPSGVYGLCITDAYGVITRAGWFYAPGLSASQRKKLISFDNAVLSVRLIYGDTAELSIVRYPITWLEGIGDAPEFDSLPPDETLWTLDQGQIDSFTVHNSANGVNVLLRRLGTPQALGALSVVGYDGLEVIETPLTFTDPGFSPDLLFVESDQSYRFGMYDLPYITLSEAIPRGSSGVLPTSNVPAQTVDGGDAQLGMIAAAFDAKSTLSAVDDQDYPAILRSGDELVLYYPAGQESADGINGLHIYRVAGLPESHALQAAGLYWFDPSPLANFGSLIAKAPVWAFTPPEPQQPKPFWTDFVRTHESI